jgi:hypothetical protein
MESQLTVDARDPMFVPMPSFLAAYDPTVVPTPFSTLTIKESWETPHVLLLDGLLKAPRLPQTPLHVKDVTSFIDGTPISTQEFQDEFGDLSTEASQEFQDLFIDESEQNTQDSLYTPAAACAYSMLPQVTTQIEDDESCTSPSCNGDAAASEYSMLPQIHAQCGRTSLADQTVATMPELSQFACNQNLKDIGEVVAKRALQSTSKREPWWKSCQSPVTCPFSGFPINLLPYPPYKLSVQSKGTRVLVDGKCLALTMISTCNFDANGWCTEKDVVALGVYVHRCKLGRRLRPDRALALVKEIGSPNVPYTEQEKKRKELNCMISAANEELKKLRCIQEQRLLRLYEELPGVND